MSDPARRALHVLVVSHDGRSVLVGDDGGLPQRTVELGDGETTTRGARRLLATWLGADLAVMELLFDEAPEAEPGSPVPTLVDLAPPPPDWAPPAPLRWSPTDVTPAVAHPGFVARVDRLLDERRGRLPVHPLRSAWSHPGWWNEITAWIDQSLAAVGRPATTTAEQVRHWGISALVRATSGEDVVWCKAVFPPFRGEPAVTTLLDRAAPGTVAPVIAADVERGWLLMEDVGAATFADRLDTPGPAIAAMTGFHGRFVGRIDDLLAAGLPDRRPAGLPSAVADALTDPGLSTYHGLDAARVSEVVGWLERSIDVIAALGLPDTLVHGDFHPGNVVSTDDGVVVFDWSDAAVSFPVVDVVTWQWWCADDACRDRTWDLFVAGWRDLVEPAALTEHRAVLEGLAAAHHVVSYATILRGLEPDRRSETSDGLTSFAARLLAAAAPSA